MWGRNELVRNSGRGERKTVFSKQIGHEKSIQQVGTQVQQDRKQMNCYPSCLPSQLVAGTTPTVTAPPGQGTMTNFAKRKSGLSKKKK